MADIPACPPTLKAIQHYLKIAQEHASRDPVVSYWSRYLPLASHGNGFFGIYNGYVINFPIRHNIIEFCDTYWFLIIIILLLFVRVLCHCVSSMELLSTCRTSVIHQLRDSPCSRDILVNVLLFCRSAVCLADCFDN